jgi:hypothetical protein
MVGHLLLLEVSEVEQAFLSGWVSQEAVGVGTALIRSRRFRRGSLRIAV